MLVKGDGRGAKALALFDKNVSGTTAATVRGLHLDYDVAGIVASGQSAYHRVIEIDYNQEEDEIPNFMITPEKIRIKKEFKTQS